MKNTQFLTFLMILLQRVWTEIKQASRLPLRWIHALGHFLLRFYTVEKRFPNNLRRAQFVWRWLRFIFHRFHLLPRWLKLIKIGLVLLLLASPYIWKFVEHRLEVSRLYDSYYPYYYAAYSKKTTPARAQYYADFYASYYAEYFASPEYRTALRYALPKPTAKVLDYERQARKENKPLKMTTDGFEMIKFFEKRMLEPYKDAGGRLTIGYGHLIRKDELFGRLTELQAEQLLLEDVMVAEAVVKRAVQVDLAPEQFSALVSLVFNIGSGHFTRSTLLKRLNDKDYDGAAEEFLRWNYVGDKQINGLNRRRVKEREMFLDG